MSRVTMWYWPVMKPLGVSSGRAGGVFEGLAWFEHGLLADDAFAFHLENPAACVGDAPGAADQLHGLFAAVFDGDAVGPDEAAIIRFGLVFQVEGSHAHFDAAWWPGCIRVANPSFRRAL